MISSKVVLTAAHCASQMGTNAAVGAFDANLITGTEELRRVVGQKIHPGYDSGSYENDIMVLLLDEPVDMDWWNVDLELSSSFGDASAGTTLTVIGHGDTTDGGSASDELLEVDVLAVDTDTCNDPSAYDGDVNEENMFCAGKTT